MFALVWYKKHCVLIIAHHENCYITESEQEEQSVAVATVEHATAYVSFMDKGSKSHACTILILRPKKEREKGLDPLFV